jgi:hypothetical protein
MNKETSTRDRKSKERQRAGSLEEDKSDPLRQGQRLDTIRDKSKLTQTAKTTKAKLESYKEPPVHKQDPPKHMHLPLDQCMPNHLETEQLHQLGSDRSDWSTPPVRPMTNM